MYRVSLALSATCLSRSLGRNLWLGIRNGRKIHQILLQPSLILSTFVELAKVLIVQNSEDKLLVLVQILLNELGRNSVASVHTLRLPLRIHADWTAADWAAADCRAPGCTAADYTADDRTAADCTAPGCTAPGCTAADWTAPGCCDSSYASLQVLKVASLQKNYPSSRHPRILSKNRRKGNRRAYKYMYAYIIRNTYGRKRA